MSIDPRGFYKKYSITKIEDGSSVEDAFVLRIYDPAARSALLRYAAVCENEQLAADLIQWIEDYEAKELDC